MQEINTLMVIIEIVLYFLLWTLVLYWIHRIAHLWSWIKKFHYEHHRFIHYSRNQKSKWEFNNLFLYNDNIKSTIDLWMTEVIPTLIFSYITGQWWILIFYYGWAAILQEIIEHNPTFNLPILTSGKWHLIHHSNVDKNYGLFFPVWDIVFLTHRSVRT